jgi:hypothetical protein
VSATKDGKRLEANGTKGHSHINAHKKRAIVTIIVAKTIAKIASKRMARLIAKPCRSISAALAEPRPALGTLDH